MKKAGFGPDAMPDSVKAILLVVGAAASTATMYNLIRYITVEQGLHAFEVAFFRSLLGLIIFVPVFARHGFGLLRTAKLPWHIARGLVNATAMLCMISALTLIPVGDATAVTLIGPVFVALLAMFFLGERVGPRRWFGISLAVAGAFVVVRPGFVDVSLGTVLVLVAILLAAASKIVAKMLSNHDSPTTIVAYLTLLMTPVTLVPALFFWQWPSFEQLLWLTGLGLCGTTGHLLLANAYRLADVSLVDPVSSMRMVWAAVISYAVFAEFPDSWTWIGAGIIVVGTSYMARRDAVRGVNRPPATTEDQ